MELKKSLFCVAGLALAWQSLATPAHASVIDSVTVGEPALRRTGNCDPFGCPEFFGLSAFVQVYAGAAFRGPLMIDDIAFFDTVVQNGGLPAGGDYSVYLSYTSLSPGGIDLNGFPGAGGKKPFYSGELPSLSGSVLDISGTPFYYDPSDGNLLLTVIVSGASDAANRLYLDQAAGTNYTTSAYSSLIDGKVVTGGNNFGGLVTGFNYTPASSAPEPGTLFLMLAGVGLIGCRFVRSRRQ